MRAINRVIGASSDSKIEGFLDAKAEGSSMSYKDIVRMNDNSGGAYAGDGPATRWSAEEIDRG